MVGLQTFEQVGLLRSLAVQAEQRGRGWGEQLARLGYRAIAREQAPPAIQTSAALMRKTLL